VNVYEMLSKCRTGICIICDQQLTEQDTDHSICDKCWELIDDEGDKE
jgi:hypothetical protein